MKTFWIIIGVIAAVTVVISLSSGNRRDRSAPDQQVQPALDSSTAVPATVAAPSKASESHASKSSASSPTPKDDRMETLAGDLKGSHEARSNSEMEELDTAIAAQPARSDAQIEKGGSEQNDGSQGLKVERQPNGSLVLDDRFVVRGAGTEKDPYRLTWEMLVSAEETYSPSQDMFEMPPRIEFLNGKHVEIAGFLFTAMLRDETSELLVMRNMWDGCCVGLPPSSYDAIEVNLKKPLWIKSRGLLESGVLRGTLVVDPYVKDNWLLGLYIVNNGTIEFEEM